VGVEEIKAIPPARKLIHMEHSGVKPSFLFNFKVKRLADQLKSSVL
jgi:hypothetical protein